MARIRSLKARRWILASTRRSLDLERDATELYAAARAAGPDYEKLVRTGAGRTLRGLTLWEDATKTLFTTNCSWSLTVKMAQAACSAKFVPASPSGQFPFPQPKAFSRHTADELRQALPVGYRAGYLRSLAIRFETDRGLALLDNGGVPFDKAYRLARSLHGFGDYAASHLLIMAGMFDNIPVDTVVTGFLKRTHGARKVESFAERKYHHWGRNRWWGLKLDQMRRRLNWIGDKTL